MSQPAYVISAAERYVVRDAIVELCQHRHWLLLAAHVRSNHIHLVVTTDLDPDRVMSDIKARASRALSKAGFADSTRRRWTRHGSTLYLHDQATVADKIDYTLNRQGAPMALYDGRP